MNSKLRDSIDNYDMVSIQGIYPVSKIDGGIISKLTSILVELEVNQSIVECLQKWKSVPDEDTLGELEKISLDIEQSEGNSLKNTKDFIDFGDFLVPISKINSISKDKYYCSITNKMFYTIVVNESETTYLTPNNMRITFDDWADRDNYLQDLKERLLSFTNIRFL